VLLVELWCVAASQHVQESILKHIVSANKNGKLKSYADWHIRHKTWTYTYVVASQCSRSHRISENYITAQSFELQFLQNSPLVQIYNFASVSKGVKNIPGSHFVKKFFQLLRRNLKEISSITKATFFNAYFRHVK